MHVARVPRAHQTKMRVGAALIAAAVVCLAAPPATGHYLPGAATKQHVGRLAPADTVSAMKASPVPLGARWT